LTSNGALVPTWEANANGITIADDTTTNATRYITFSDLTTGTETTLDVSSTKLTYNPSTGGLTVSGLANVDNLRLDGNTISSTDTNGNIVLAPNGTGDVLVDADTLQVGDSGSDATIQSNGNADLILKTGNATTGSVTLADGADGSLTVALNGTGQVIVNAGAVGTPTIAPTGDTNTGIFFPGADRIGFAEGGAQCGEFDASGNFQFNSGYGSVATAYGCRAWVNFNGTANSNLSGTYTRTSPSTTVTVTATAHGYITGNLAYLDFTSGTAVDGTYTVTVVDADTFTVTTVASTTTSGNVTLRRNTIRASGNVSSITDEGTGEYRVNFTTAMPDADYSVVVTTGGTNVRINASSPQTSGIDPTTTSTSVGTFIDSSSTFTDSRYIHVAIFR